MSGIDGLTADVRKLVNEFLAEEAVKVKAKDLRLDVRAGSTFWVTSDAIIVPKYADNTLQYYGGFEYVDKPFRTEIGDYVFYLSEDSRVSDHLEYYADSVEDKDFDEAIEKLLVKDQITPYPHAGSNRTGDLQGLTYKDICDILGFKPNCNDDPDKVKYSWGFTYKDKHFGVWDYKGGHKYKEWSTYGDHNLLREIFGHNYVTKTK